MKKLWCKVNHWVTQCWYTRRWWRWLLWPLACVYQGITGARRYVLERFYQQTFTVPVVVIGNLTVGGVGKTPFVIALAQQLRKRGVRVGIVSRGYGATVTQFPHEVREDDLALWVGDEPLLLARNTQCPVVIAPKRVQAVQYLLDKYQTQVVLSDDGLQHYALGRAIEIVIVDGERGFGNGLCLPAGPLREGTKRLCEVDFIIVNGHDSAACRSEVSINHRAIYSMELVPGSAVQLTTGQALPWKYVNAPFAAVAGIGNPQRFFAMLEELTLAFKPYVFSDHHPFIPRDLQFAEKTIVMTEKDAVKCLPFATDSMYFVPVTAKMSAIFWETLWSHLQLESI